MLPFLNIKTSILCGIKYLKWHNITQSLFIGSDYLQSQFQSNRFE